jgi:Mce-associated membrane protein
MTDEGAETVARVTTVEETEPDVTTITETTEAVDADDAIVDGETVVVTDEDHDGLTTTPADTAGGVRWPLVGAIAGVCGGLLVATGILGWQVWQQHQIKQAGTEAQRAAVSYAQVLTSIDSNKVDENFKEVLDGATGEFKDMYSQSSVELRQLLIENKATAHGVVVDSAVQEASKNKAVVLLFVDQSVTNTKLPDPRIDRSRMKMTLEKVDGRWRASKVELP